MTFINTRPSDRAKPLTEHLHQAGVDVLDLPLLTMQPLSLGDSERNKLGQWQSYDVVVVVSPTAAKLFLQQITNTPKCTNPKTSSATKPLSEPAPTPTHTPTLVAVGRATATVLERLEQYRITVQIPKTSNNEGMLAMPCIAELQAGQQVLICRGVGGRRLLIEALSERNVQVDTVSLYQRQLPEQTQAIFVDWVTQTFACGVTDEPAIQTNRPLATVLATVLISSGESFEHWRQICQHLPTQLQQPQNLSSDDRPTKKLSEFAKLSRYHYLVLGERLYAMLCEQQLDVTQLDNLEPQHIVTHYQKLIVESGMRKL